jgi:hypothetical protein
MGKLFDFCGGRKTTFALLLLVALTTFLFLDKCVFAEWLDGIIWIFGVYAVGNGVEHVGKGISKKV